MLLSKQINVDRLKAGTWAGARTEVQTDNGGMPSLHTSTNEDRETEKEADGQRHKHTDNQRDRQRQGQR
jgi:hypothetical protein